MKLKKELKNGAGRESKATMVSVNFRVSRRMLDSLELMAEVSGSSVECWVNALLAEALVTRKERVMRDLSGGAEA